MRPSQIRIERLNQRIAYQSINATQITRMITRIAIKLITFYQYCLSMLIGSQCRFYPTCSQYTKEAIETHGLLKGFYLGSRRIARCHPWHEGGFDPVPGTPALTDTQDIFPDK